jgi:hypothetical protein
LLKPTNLGGYKPRFCLMVFTCYIENASLMFRERERSPHSPFVSIVFQAFHVSFFPPILKLYVPFVTTFWVCVIGTYFLLSHFLFRSYLFHGSWEAQSLASKMNDYTLFSFKNFISLSGALYIIKTMHFNVWKWPYVENLLLHWIKLFFGFPKRLTEILVTFGV